MKLKLQEALALYRQLNRLTIPASAIFNYAVVFNRRLLQPVYESAAKAAQHPKELGGFAAQRNKLVAKYARRNQRGIMPADPCSQFTDPEAYARELAELEAAHPDEARQCAQIERGFAALLEQEQDFNLKLILLSDVPHGLASDEFEVLLPMIQAQQGP